MRLTHTIQISRDELLQKLPSIPSSMTKNAHTIERFVSTYHQITLALLSCLSASLGKDFGSSHREGHASNSGLKLESVPFDARLEDVPPSEHTDMGTLTLLFCPHYTTEIRMPGTEEWGFIVPKEGHAIVNVADSLQALSNKTLLSCLHRVGQPAPGAGERICALYYLRPEDGVSLD